ncbi:ABC transporter ATP-binding protein [Cognatilysobacter segetis]|uniref:ABC transporter ATP-binding protein n=1 Tax=Cognatilysobacter segetis TaxID=2492394 RepID=UPI001EE3A2BD|nr:ABC transporter ATP-binding protein [Lysobacter segetis]
MNSPSALSATHVGKTYRMWPSPAARLTAPALHRLGGLLARVAPSWGLRIQAHARNRVHTHDALSDVTFELARGEALGIIGLNGSGKSTLLQIVAGVLPPSTGAVQVNGRVAALLELGSGFNPELSGRENIYINAAILGLDRAYVEARLQDIIAFADIGDYVDEPVKTYSSGMVVRLAFAVLAHTQPDILIVDEALAVGDAAFQAKAMSKIEEILAQGTTLLFVGHDLNAVKAFCHRAMLLERGRIVMEGLPDEVITEYLLRVHRRALEQTRREGPIEPIERLDDGYGSVEARVDRASVNGAHHVTLRHGDALELEFEVRLGPGIAHPALIVDVMDGKGLQLTGRRIALPPSPASGRCTIRVAMDAIFQQGVYRVRTRVVDAPSLDQTSVLSRQEGKLSFEVVDDCRERFTGLFPVPMTIEVD